MLVDLAAARLCDRVNGKFLAITAKAGTSFEGSRSATVGSLWVESCRAEEASPERLRVSLKGRGWKWLDRTSEKVLADFSVHQYLRFGIDASVVGALSMTYAPQEHIATLWFKPSQSPDVHFDPLQDVEVDEEGLWSELVGTAAEIAATDPDRKANTKVQRKGSRKARQGFSEGFSYAYDLCSSRSYSQTGLLPPGKLPKPAIEYQDDRDYLVNSDAVLHPGGLVLAGPFDPEQTVVAEVRVAPGSAPVKARLVCREQAGLIADAYLKEQHIPSVIPLAARDVPAGEHALLKAVDARCESVLALEPAQSGGSPETRVVVKYSVYPEGDFRKPLARCKASSKGSAESLEGATLDQLGGAREQRQR